MVKRPEPEQPYKIFTGPLGHLVLVDLTRTVQQTKDREARAGMADLLVHILRQRDRLNEPAISQEASEE
jgi:hypothetical protein